jgi:3-phenylpropionate/trans-cinnamate dioxygenase ferredoxin reductase component
MTAAGRTFVLAGGGMTAAATAHTLRSEGFDGRVVLVSAESHLPYERPPLSKEYLRGEHPAEETTFLSEGWYEEHQVELLLGERVVRVQPGDRTVELRDGRRLGYDALLIATGGENRRLPIPGWELDGVLGLRSIEDADRIRQAAVPGSRAVIAGAGFIGCEVAASLRQLGVEVDVVELFEAPLVRVLGPKVAAVYEALHREHGVWFHFGQGVERFEGPDRVERVVTTTGARLECDFVVTGVGIAPVTDLLEGSGIEVANGVLVDGRCRTNAPGVLAAGDVANHLHPVFGRLRVEHYDNALKQGTAAARTMLGRDEPYGDLHWFWSDQYDTNLQYLGFALEWDAFVTRGSLEGRSFVGFYVREGMVDAVVGMNRGREVRRAAGLIAARRPVDVRALADEDVDVRKLAAGLAREADEPAEGSVTA